MKMQQSTSSRAAALDTFSSWAMQELQGWHTCCVPPNLPFCIDNAASLSDSLFRVDVSSTGARLYPKANAPLVFHNRAAAYVKFLNELVQDFYVRPLTLAIDVNDESKNSTDFPVFTFQKQRESVNILLPDVDFLDSPRARFYADVATDHQPFSCKYRSAIFVGSTTGIPVITHRDLDLNLVPRIRLWRYARAKQDIVVRLPNITQCLDASVEMRLLEEGLGGPEIAWRDQIGHQFLISIDGNGAACSRVYLALTSNCVLLKYESSNVLHYFRGLVPDKHFISVRNDEELPSIVKMDEDRAGKIAIESRRFAEDLLGRESLLSYTARLLFDYSLMF